jgi:hypothetical protein
MGALGLSALLVAEGDRDSGKIEMVELERLTSKLLFLVF